MISTVDNALAKQGQTLAALERWKAEMPTEAEMLPRDKYTVFDRKAKRYRKGIHRRLPLLSSLYRIDTAWRENLVGSNGQY